MKLIHFLAGFLFFLCIALIYRTIDMGVSLDYSQHELGVALKDIRTLKEFQGRKCSAELAEKRERISVFRKGDIVVIDGLAFRCEHGLLRAVDYN